MREWKEILTKRLIPRYSSPILTAVQWGKCLFFSYIRGIKVKRPAQVYAVGNCLNSSRTRSVFPWFTVGLGHSSWSILKMETHSDAWVLVCRALCWYIPRVLLGFMKVVFEQYGPAHNSANAWTLYISPAPLVDLTPTHSGSAMLMLLSVVFVGLAVFVIYKFKRCVFSPSIPHPPNLFPLSDRFRSSKSLWNSPPEQSSDAFCWCFRKIPGINVYAQMQNEKEQELISPVSHTESRPTVPHPDLRRPGQPVDEKVESQLLGKWSLVAISCPGWVVNTNPTSNPFLTPHNPFFLL